MRPAAVLLILSLAAPSLAAAQAQPDVIGSILDAPPRTTPAVPEEPDTAAQPVTRQPDLEAGLPSGPQPYAPPPPKLDRPVQLEETGRSPDTPSVRDLAYDSRIRSSFAAAQRFQGPLDGEWTLSAAGAGDLYAFKLSDRGRGEVEGAWRDLRRKGALDGSGFIDEVARTDTDVVLKFRPEGAAAVTVTLQNAVGAIWPGQLVQGGQTQTVSLRKAPTP